MARYGIVKATAIIKYIIFEALYALDATKIGKSKLTKASSRRFS